MYGYADEIFSVGQNLMDALEGQPTGRPLQLRVGIADVFPKLLAYEFLAPAFKLDQPVHAVCYQGKPGALLARLGAHELDVIFSESPIGPEVRLGAFNHQLGECGVSILAAKSMAAAYRQRFPGSLAGAPFLLPTENFSLRRTLNHWFATESIRPSIVGEFEDSALMKVFGQAGVGLFAAPTAIEKQVRQQYGVDVVGRLESVQERFYAISLERKLKHPAVVSIVETAHGEIFD